MELALVEEGAVAGCMPAAAAPLPRHARKIPERLPPALAMLSFTGLALGTDDPEPAPEYADPPLADATAANPVADGIAGFARGARAGRCLHAILEHVDLGMVRRDPRDPEVAAVIRRELQRHGLEQAGAHPGAVDPAGAVAAMLVELATAEAPLLGLRFADLQPERCQREWQFVLPVQDLQPRALARAFAQNGHGPVAAYARRLQALSPRAISGFLMGFVDLVAEQDGRWFVLDWKSNHLGAGPADYRRDALSRCMSEHDYVLQYHLYTLALDLLLQQRLRGYDYERHFGGVCYVFLRGVRAGGDLGLFVDRPPHALIAALRRWTEGARP
jgi:exodeoxyribonuclease V beta subunit